MRIPVLACLLAACGGGDPIGITFTFAPMPGVETVELFVAKSASVGMSGPPRTAPMPAKLFEVPHDSNGPSLVDANSGFLLVNDTAESYLIETLAVLGYDKDGNAIAAYQHHEQILVVPGASEHWQLTLESATDIVPGTMGSREEYRARRWKRSDNTMPSCAIIEHDGERKAFGPIGDRDCDEKTIDSDEQECAPWIFLLDTVMAPSGFANTTCGTRETLVPGFPQACMASGSACTEVGMTDRTCTKLTQDYCVTPALCECPTWDHACLSGKLNVSTFASTSSYIKCHVCATQMNYPTTNLKLLLGPSTPSTCSDIRIRELGPPATPILPLLDKATFASGELKIADHTPDCVASFEWSGMAPPANTPDDVAFVSLDIDNNGVTKHAVVPLFVSYDCEGTPQTCEAHPHSTDTSRLCAEPPPPIACGPDALCGYSTWCGGTCCEPGETCFGGQCGCGTAANTCGPTQICGNATSGFCGSQCCTPDGTGNCVP